MTLAFWKYNSPIKTFLALALALCWVSQSAMDFCIGILTLLVLQKWFSPEKAKLKELFKSLKIPLLMMFCYFIVAALGFLFNSNPEAQALISLSKFGWIIIFIVFTAGFYLERFSWEQTLKYFCFAFLLPAIYGFNIFFNNGADLIYEDSKYWRIVGLINSATYHAHIGGFIFVSLFMLQFFTYKNLNIKYKIISSLSLLLIGASTALTLTRGAWISTMCSIILFLFIWNWKKTLGILTVAMVALGLLVFLTNAKSVAARQSSDNCRKKLLEVHLNMVKQYPLLGIGYRDNMRDLKPYWPDNGDRICRNLRNEGTHAHNQYLNVAATTGLLGFMFFMGFWVYFFIINLRLVYSARKTKNANLYRWSISTLILLVYYSLANMTETDFEYGKVRFPLIVVWALIMALNLIQIQRSSADIPEQFS